MNSGALRSIDNRRSIAHMGRINHQHDNAMRRARASAGDLTKAERIEHGRESTRSIIVGMGKGRFSKAADKFMGAEPARRIDPNSPEGREIAARARALVR